MPIVPAEKALEMATIDWDRSRGLSDDIGSIGVGTEADLVLFDTERPKWRNLINPVTNLVYNADGRSVHSMIVEGPVAVENHAPTFVDTWELIQRVQGVGRGLLERAGISFPPRWAAG